jgi:hypothetical protein
MEIHQQSAEMSRKLMERLGVQTEPNGRVTMIVISKDRFMGFDVLFRLVTEYETIHKKNVDPMKLSVVVLPTLEAVSMSPHLERSSFILTIEDNDGIGDLLGVENYPELGKILPFK